MSREVFLHGCNKITCTVLNDTSTHESSRIITVGTPVYDLTPNSYIHVLKPSKVRGDIVCIKFPDLYVTLNLDKKYKDIFKKPKARYKSQFIDYNTYLKLINKEVENELILDQAYNKLYLFIKGAYNQTIEISSEDNSSNVIISHTPHYIENEDILYNNDFEDLYFKYPYIWVGKLNRAIRFTVTENNDLDIFISCYKNPDKLKFKLIYNELIPNDVKVNVAQTNPKFKAIKNILSTNSDVEAIYKVMFYIKKILAGSL